MTVSIPFEQQFTWRKLGYLFFSDSLSYREVLEQNPEWNVTELPPLGAQIRIRENIQNRNGLVQGNFIFGPQTEVGERDFFPFSNEETYVKSLIKYSPSAVSQRERINGYAIDSEFTTIGG